MPFSPACDTPNKNKVEYCRTKQNEEEQSKIECLVVRRCVGCLADKASPVSWRVLVTPIPPQAAPLPRSQEFSFVLEGTRHSKPTSRLHHCLADILLLCPGGYSALQARLRSDLRDSEPTPSSDSAIHKHTRASQTRLLRCPGGVLGTPSPRNCSVLKAFFPEPKKILSHRQDSPLSWRGTRHSRPTELFRPESLLS